ncbi:hypothetical protein TSUD_129450 [Trifolium subterraneum]|uniref:Uncharacterized protein n=1 Tax=Trifolium subterraneum TaxID=3900 RepID=A0A2Z6PI70_TRISU|nr:hypothetical protein TSUD_129450 [Trifolium subterraneum]
MEKALDFEPEEDDLISSDNATDADASHPHPKLKSAIIVSSTLSIPRKTKIGHLVVDKSTCRLKERIVDHLSSALGILGEDID